MNKNDGLEVSEARRLACNVVAGASIIMGGCFLLLVGLGAIPLKLSDVIFPSIFLCIALTFIITAFLQRNTVALWVSFFFLVPAVAVLLDVYVPALSQADIYPVYIAIPAISSLFTMLMSKEWKDHIGTIVVFGVLAILFSLQSSGAVGWGVVLPAVLIFAGAGIVFFSVRTFHSKNREDDR